MRLRVIINIQCRNEQAKYEKNKKFFTRNMFLLWEIFMNTHTQSIGEYIVVFDGHKHKKKIQKTKTK